MKNPTPTARVDLSVPERKRSKTSCWPVPQVSADQSFAVGGRGRAESLLEHMSTRGHQSPSSPLCSSLFVSPGSEGDGRGMHGTSRRDPEPGVCLHGASDIVAPFASMQGGDTFLSLNI